MSKDERHLTVEDLTSIAKSCTAETFAARFPHPFLFGREVLEEEFNFQTLVTEDSTGEITRNAPATAGLRIRHWVIPVKKPSPDAPGQDRVFLGRAETNDLCVPHATVSKLHGYFTRDPGIVTRWFLVDLGSVNGTRVNGKTLEPRARQDLVDGDHLCFGRCLFQWLSAHQLHERILTMSS